MTVLEMKERKIDRTLLRWEAYIFCDNIKDITINKNVASIYAYQIKTRFSEGTNLHLFNKRCLVWLSKQIFARWLIINYTSFYIFVFKIFKIAGMVANTMGITNYPWRIHNEHIACKPFPTPHTATNTQKRSLRFATLIAKLELVEVVVSEGNKNESDDECSDEEFWCRLIQVAVGDLLNVIFIYFLFNLCFLINNYLIYLRHNIKQY